MRHGSKKAVPFNCVESILPCAKFTETTRDNYDTEKRKIFLLHLPVALRGKGARALCMTHKAQRSPDSATCTKTHKEKFATSKKQSQNFRQKQMAQCLVIN